MEKRQVRRMRKQEKSHGASCWKCERPKRNGCYSSNCIVQHCTCSATDPNIKD